MNYQQSPNTPKLYFLDRMLQRWRISKALPYIPQGAKVLDIGSSDGILFRVAGEQIGYGVGIDPLVCPENNEKYRLLSGFFPEGLKTLSNLDLFQAITMLAVLEHIPEDKINDFILACNQVLTPGGVVIITVPDAKVDVILEVLKFFRLVKTMSFEEHYGFDTKYTIPLFEGAGFEKVVHKRFQLGLNNLFVFRKKS